MNALLSLFTADCQTDKPANILAAARALAPHLARSRPIDRRLLSNTMTTFFGGSDAEGLWDWRDAYDAVEAAIVLQLRRLAPQLSRLEDAPADIVALLANVQALAPTQTRRDEEQVALDQFSTPPAIGALAVLAAQVRETDRVLEPSAGTGLLAVLAEGCGAQLELNEIAAQRAAILDGLFPSALRTRHDGAHLADLSPQAGSFDAVITNPPFAELARHLLASLGCLADGGRMAAIVPASALEDHDLLEALGRRRGAIVARIMLPARAFAKHGTSVDTGLLVIDRVTGEATQACPVIACETLADAAVAASSLTPRGTAKPRKFRSASTVALLAPRARSLATPSNKLSLLTSVCQIDYETKPWSGEGRDVGIFQDYAVGRVAFAQSHSHPSPLVEAAAMASVPMPAPTYKPVLPAGMIAQGLVSDAQMETIVYAGEAHAEMLPGWWLMGEASHDVTLVSPETPGAIQFRRGFFLGDGTGCGKGRQLAGVAADNMAQGRLRAVWLSKNDALLEDARRDWKAIGGAASDIVPQSAWKQADAIRMDRGILFTTYATLRQPARGSKKSRLEQIVDWLGSDFDGVILFDEAHAMANASPSGKGARGAKKASLQGMAGLALQNLLPNARVVYCSATGATTPDNLAYAARLGLWGGPDAPFATRAAFMDAIIAGGTAAMELISRELKAMGLYIARSLSFDGVEYDPLTHELTSTDIEIWNEWADAFQIIHHNLKAALDAVGVNDEEGKPKSPLAASAAKSAFASTSQRFFGHLLAGLKAPTVVGAIRQHLADGMSCVVQIVSTNEAVMERRLSEIPPEEWNNLSIDLSPKDYVMDYLEHAFPVNLMDEVKDEDGNVTLVPVLKDGVPVMSQEALRLKEELILKLACLPAVPSMLDALLNELGPEEVAEVTGRSRRVVQRNGRRFVERRSASANKAETDAFMSGRKRVLVFSDAGGTGRSYHADLASGSSARRRVHLLIEPGWRSDVAVQGLGRSHRTNQASAPLFRPVSTPVQGEKRFISTISRRMDSMGALTKGERRAAGNGLFKAEDNLESPWARQALDVFYCAMFYGDLRSMSRETFEAKTGLALADYQGNLKEPEDRPPMNTFLNRLLALRIEDQNALFEDFEEIMKGILERAAASGQLDRGVEDVSADDLTVLSEEVIRTDAVTGAETRLITFDLKTRRELLSAEEAADLVDSAPERSAFVINGKSGRAAVVQKGLTTSDDDNRIAKAVRLIRPDERRLERAKTFQESSWEECDRDTWLAAWNAEVANADPWQRRKLTLVTGLLLPIWSMLPNHMTWVRRVKAPDGRRWLGRILDPSHAAALKVKLGISDAAAAIAAADDVEAMLIAEGKQLALAGGMFLRRARVMDQWRLEVVGGLSERAALMALGGFVEIINHSARIFLPVGQEAILRAVIKRFPVQSIDLAA